MKKLLLFILLSASLQAGDSGSYFNLERAGEGMFLERNGDRIFFGIFTFGEERCVPIVPDVSPSIVTEMCNLNGQRWFVGLGDFNEVSNSFAGALYISDGLDFPFALMDKVAESSIVGIFILRREGDGFEISVTQFGPRLEPSDPLFSDLMKFTARAFEAKD